jgi:DNA-binding response OmpR family regulator
LKPREFALLEVLAKRPGVVFTLERLLDVAWPEAEAVEDEHTVDVHVRRLRSKLGAGLNVRTVHGVGYTLDPPDKKRKT